MADFVQNANVKSAIRTLAAPIEDIASFDAIVQSVITGNPFGSVAYMVGSTSHQPVEKSREAYVVKLVYHDALSNVVGNDSSKYDTVAGFNAGSTALLADAANIAAHAGTPARDYGHDTYSATLKCHDPNGELFMVAFSRDQVTLTSYEDDAIRTKVETWADTVPELA